VNIAWFSPQPPNTSGIAAYSAELTPQLAARGFTIEKFGAETARDFVWKRRRRPYDLTVFQMGNDTCHDFMWAYLFRYPGLVVLHDAQLHQARALWLTRRWKPRRDDYLAEFRANHPEAPADVGELIAAGLGGSLYHHWPLVRLVVERARLTVVHSRRLMEDLRDRYPSALLEHIEMGVADPLAAPSTRAGAEDSQRHAATIVRERHHLRPDSVVLAAFGGITPEKRIPQLIRAVSTLADRLPTLHLLLVGHAAAHYDVVEDARQWGVADRVHLAGYVRDDRLSEYLQAADICACLRWPTNRETSASWLRCIGAGRATIVTDLTHQADVPTLDPRGWRILDAAARAGDGRRPVAVSVDLLDEQHSIELALERLATDAALRAALGQAARGWWAQHHQVDDMAAAYQRIVRTAVAAPVPNRALPPHRLADASDHARALARHLGVGERLDDLLRD
jgi:glycosyltransferase involved in cell wall biosynthesis